jgi:hypothetical protein
LHVKSQTPGALQIAVAFAGGEHGEQAAPQLLASRLSTHNEPQT